MGAVHLAKFIVVQRAKKIYAFLWNRKVRYSSYKSLTHVPILNQRTPIYALAFHLHINF